MALPQDIPDQESEYLITKSGALVSDGIGKVHVYSSLCW